jgi:succinate dehydrogenase/fumarate reductase-like Fe-S protein
MLIEDHPVFGKRNPSSLVNIYFEERKFKIEENLTIASALMLQGITALGYSHRLRDPRGYFCGTGRCFSCAMTVNGKRNIRTCMTRVENDMKIKRTRRNTQ